MFSVALERQDQSFATMARNSTRPKFITVREMKVEQRFTLVAHPQTNGQVEVTNWILVDAIKKPLDMAGGKLGQ